MDPVASSEDDEGIADNKRLYFICTFAVNACSEESRIALGIWSLYEPQLLS